MELIKVTERAEEIVIAFNILKGGHNPHGNPSELWALAAAMVSDIHRSEEKVCQRLHYPDSHTAT